jgi:hypothetical protein
MDEAARTPRYHYAASVPLALVMVMAAARVSGRLPSGERTRDVAWALAGALLIAGFVRDGRPVNLHADSRAVAERLLAQATAAARAAVPGATVYLSDGRPPLLVWGPVTRAQLFSVLRIRSTKHVTDKRPRMAYVSRHRWHARRERSGLRGWDGGRQVASTPRRSPAASAVTPAL